MNSKQPSGTQQMSSENTAIETQMDNSRDQLPFTNYPLPSWTHGMYLTHQQFRFECSDSLSLFAKSCFCPCIVSGMIDAQLSSRPDVSCDRSCILDAFLTLFCLCSCYNALHRNTIRRISGIRGNMLRDACKHCCCYPCALTQEARELGIE